MPDKVRRRRVKYKAGGSYMVGRGQGEWGKSGEDKREIGDLGNGDDCTKEGKEVRQLGVRVR